MHTCVVLLYEYTTITEVMRKFYILYFPYSISRYIVIRSKHSFFLLYPGQPSFSDLYLCRMNMIPSVCKPRCQFRHKHFPYSRHRILYTLYWIFLISTCFNFMLIVVLVGYHTTAECRRCCMQKIFFEIEI